MDTITIISEAALKHAIAAQRYLKSAAGPLLHARYIALNAGFNSALPDDFQQLTAFIACEEVDAQSTHLEAFAEKTRRLCEEFSLEPHQAEDVIHMHRLARCATAFEAAYKHAPEQARNLEKLQRMASYKALYDEWYATSAMEETFQQRAQAQKLSVANVKERATVIVRGIMEDFIKDVAHRETKDKHRPRWVKEHRKEIAAIKATMQPHNDALFSSHPFNPYIAFVDQALFKRMGSEALAVELRNEMVEVVLRHREAHPKKEYFAETVQNVLRNEGFGEYLPSDEVDSMKFATAVEMLSCAGVAMRHFVRATLECELGPVRGRPQAQRDKDAARAELMKAAQLAHKHYTSATPLPNGAETSAALAWGKQLERAIGEQVSVAGVARGRA